MVERLEFHNIKMDIAPPISDDELQIVFPMLTTFSWTGYEPKESNCQSTWRFPNKIINLYGDRLKVLRRHKTKGMLIEPATKLDNLRRLEIFILYYQMTYK